MRIKFIQQIIGIIITIDVLTKFLSLREGLSKIVF